MRRSEINLSNLSDLNNHIGDSNLINLSDLVLAILFILSWQSQ